MTDMDAAKVFAFEYVMDVLSLSKNRISCNNFLPSCSSHFRHFEFFVTNFTFECVMDVLSMYKYGI